MSEVWLPVPSDHSLEVSSLGRIRKDGGTPTYGYWDGKRYVWARRHTKTRKVARLVCETFHGHPSPNQVCMHIDENSRNNRPENLKWGTQKENLNFPGFINYCHSRVGDNSPVRKHLNEIF